MTPPCLLLQKPSQNSKAKDHSKALCDRLKLRKKGKINVKIVKGHKL